MSSSHSLSQQIVSVKPIVVPSPGRGIDLQVKVTAPRSGQNLPVIVFSHGNAWSLDGYEPLVDRWAAAGFVVVQPTHLDSRRNAIAWDDPRFATVWRVRITDLHTILDHLADVLAQAGLETRADRERTAVVGHPGAPRPRAPSSVRACWTRRVSRERTSPTPRFRPVR